MAPTIPSSATATAAVEQQEQRRRPIQTINELLFLPPSSPTGSSSSNTNDSSPGQNEAQRPTTLVLSAEASGAGPPSLPSSNSRISLMSDWTNVEREIHETLGYAPQLRDLYHRYHDTTSSNSNSCINSRLVLITGPSGVGKSGLAMSSLKSLVEQDGGWVCHGKFEAPQYHHPPSVCPQTSSSSSSFGPFINMMNDWIHQVVVSNTNSDHHRHFETMQALQHAIHHELDSSEIKVMEESIPSLFQLTRLMRNATASSIIDNSHQHHQHQHHHCWQGLQGMDAEKRYMHIFSKLVQAILSCDGDSCQGPWVMILDDVQWADANSIELLQLLLLSSSSSSSSSSNDNHQTRGRGLMIICTLRTDDDDDDDNEHHQQQHQPHLDILRQASVGGVATDIIQMDNLPLPQVHTLVSSILQLTLEETQTLSHMIHQHTKGNPFFIIQLLSVLCYTTAGHQQQQGLLYKDPATGQYQYNINKQDNESISITTTSSSQQQLEPDLSPHPNTLLLLQEPASVVTLLAHKMSLLSDYQQRVFKVASCLGGTMIHKCLLLETVIPSNGVQEALVTLMQQGLIAYDEDTGTGRFLHDRIQEAAYYQLIPDHRARAAMHLDIGLRLWIWLRQPVERETHLFTIANQIIHGMHLLLDDDHNDPIEKEELAAFMLRVAEKASLSSSFSMAAVFLDVGMKLLGRNHWKRQYRLSLALYNAAVEIHYYNGNLARVDMLLQVIFKRAVSLDDKLRAHFIQIYSLGSRDDMAQALEKGMDVLKLLGESFPRTPSKFKASCCLQKCRWMLRRKSDDDIMNLPVITDHRKQVVLRLLNTIFVFAWLKEELIPHMVLRMIDITVRNGISPMSCVGFALLGYYLGRRGQPEEGYRYCRLGLRIMEELNAKEWQCRVALAVVGGVYYMKHPINVLFKHLRESHRAGLVVGDIHFSMVCASLQCRVCFFASMPLPAIENLMNGYQRLCDQYGQHSVSAMLKHQRQVCLNFMGRSVNPLVLTGDLMDENETMEALLQGKHAISSAWVLLQKHLLAVYFNDLESATSIALALKNMQSVIRKTGTVLPFVLSTHLFLEGLALATLSRLDKKKIGPSRLILDKLKSDKHSGQQNFENKIYLLEAEMAASKGDREVALAKYRESIEFAQRAGFLNEQALACEKAGRAIMEWNEHKLASDYIMAARSIYKQWGALAKVDHLDAYLRDTVEIE